MNEDLYALTVQIGGHINFTFAMKYLRLKLAAIMLFMMPQTVFSITENDVDNFLKNQSGDISVDKRIYAHSYPAFLKEAQSGNSFAQYILGEMYEYGLGVVGSEVEAMDWYMKSAQQGYARAQHKVGLFFFHGRAGLQADEQAARSWWQQAADKQFPNAQFELGLSLCHSKTMSLDCGKGVSYLKAAANQKWTSQDRALFAVGEMYYLGLAGKKDPKEALNWFQAAAKLYYTPAMYQMAMMHERGEGIPQDLATSLSLYKQAADRGHAESQYYLGFLYHSGQFVQKDPQQALLWFQRAAESNNRDALFALAVMYDTGEGVSMDMSQAHAFYKAAAEQGHEQAQYILGDKYSRGLGVPKDASQAYAWYACSRLSRALPEAKKHVREFLIRLSESQRREAIQQARDFRLNTFCNN